MSNEITPNPGVPRVPETPEYGRDKPRLGEGEEAQPQKPFSLPPEAGKEGSAVAPETDKPTPMELMKDGSQGKQLAPEELSQQLETLKSRLNEINDKLQNPNVTKQFAPEHYEAMNRVIDKMNPDMRTIANNSKGEFALPQHKKGESALNYVTQWVNGSQQTLSHALNYLSQDPTPNPGAFLKLQYGVQRAVQRGELFASIVSSSVQGVKTIMSTQLG